MTKTNFTTKDVENLMLDLLQIETNRINHTLQVVENVTKLADEVNLTTEEKDILIQSAYLHDIGYSQEINKTKFHPYDGFVYTEDLALPQEVRLLILHHSYADVLLEMQNNSNFKEAYLNNPVPKHLKKLLYLLSLADFTADSKGNKVTIENRIKDIHLRYTKSSPIGRHATLVGKLLREGIPMDLPNL